MRVLVCGGREYTNVQWVRDVLSALCDMVGPFTVIEGFCRGPDQFAGKWAFDVGLPYEEYPAQWDTYGKRAGVLRNQQMLDTGIDLVLAFHDNLEESRGTKDMVNRARSAGVKVIVL